MSGTKEGGIKARDANLAKDPEFYIKIGAQGGSVSRPHTRPFHINRKLAKEAGRKGGRKSVEVRRNAKA